MIDDLIENIDRYLRVNSLGKIGDRMTIDYIKMSVNLYKKQQNEEVLEGQYEESETADAL